MRKKILLVLMAVAVFVGGGLKAQANKKLYRKNRKFLKSFLNPNTQCKPLVKRIIHKLAKGLACRSAAQNSILHKQIFIYNYVLTRSAERIRILKERIYKLNKAVRIIHRRNKMLRKRIKKLKN